MNRLTLLVLFAAGCNTFTPVQPDGGGSGPGSDAGVDAALDSDAGPAATPRITIDSEVCHFGDLMVEERSSGAHFTIRNEGDAATDRLAVRLEGDVDQFEKVSDSCDDQVLAAGQPCEIQIDFLPHAAGNMAVQLIVDGADAGIVVADLDGRAVLPGELVLDTSSSFDFGAIAAGGVSEPIVVTVSNTGDVPTGPLAVDSSAPDAIVIIADDCTDVPLDVDGSCHVTVQFAPQAVGDHHGSIAILASPGGEAVRNFAGTGTARVVVATTGGGAGTVTSTPAGLDCGAACDVSFGTSSVSLTATAAPGGQFLGWTGACAASTTATCALTLTADVSVGARFEGPQPLGVAVAGTGAGTVASNPTGISCGSDCDEAFPFGQVVTLSALAASGSTFTGWTGACTGSAPSCTVTMDSVRETTATFTLDQELLTVNRAGNGTGTVASNPAGISCGADCTETYAHGTSVVLTASAAIGSAFAGWSGACTGTSTCTVAMNDVTTVTATFALQVFALTVSKSGTGAGTVTSSPPGIDCSVDCTEIYGYGIVVTLTATPATGSTFGGWSGACSGAGACQVTIDQARSVGATFTANLYNLVVSRAGSGSGAVTSTPAGIDCGGDCVEALGHGVAVTLTAASAPGSTFTSWGGACTGTSTTCTVTMDAAKNVTATFSAIQYLLTVTKSGAGTGTVSSVPGGIGCGTDCTEPYAYGTAVALTPAAASGSLFAGWSGACSGTGACTVTLDAARTVNATFQPNPDRTLTVIRAGTGAGTVGSTPTGIDCGATCAHDYGDGTSVTLTASSASGSTFSGWGGACTGAAATCTVTMGAAKTVVATFTLDVYALTVTKAGTGAGAVTSSPSGIDCGPTCSGSFGHGTVVTLSAAPAAGSTLVWSGACTGSASTCTVTMTAARSVTATFTLAQHLLSVAKTGNGAGTVTSNPAGIDCNADCSETYAYGTAVTLSASPSPTSTFSGWSGACTGAALTCTVGIDAAKSVTATFALRQYPLTVTRAGTGAGAVASNPAGVSCGSDCTESYDHGTSVTLTATPVIGSTFTGWAGACAGTATTCSVTIDAAKNVTATFALVMNTLTVARAGNGTGTVTSNPVGVSCGSDCTEAYGYGTSVTLTAAATVGSTFDGWSGACTGAASTCTVTLDAARSVTATFTLNTHVLTVTRAGTGAGTVSSNPGGVSCGSDCTEGYGYGTAVTLTAAASTGSTFAGWSGACTGAGSCVVTMDAARTVTATFTLNIYTLTVNRTGTGEGVVTSTPAGINCGTDCSEPYGHGAAVTLHASVITGSGFAGWSGACTGSANTCTVTIDAAKTVTARFEPMRTLTVNAEDSSVYVGGSVQESCTWASCAYSVPDYSAHSVTVDPGNGIFVKWTGSVCNNVTTPTCNFTMSGNETVSARICPDDENLFCCSNPSAPVCQCDSTLANIPC